MLFEKIQLEPGEQLLKVVRKHWFIVVAELFITFLMGLFPLFALFGVALFPELTQALSFQVDNHTALITFAVSTWLLLLLMSGFMIWTHYFLDLWIITDRRIILIDQIHFFNRDVKSFRLDRLQDIEFSINGVIPTFLNFGTLRAQTASASEDNFKTSGLPDPRGLQAMIQQAMDGRIAAGNKSSEPV